MKVTSVTYSIRLSLGNYQHEELSATIEPEMGEICTGDDLMRAARKVCIGNTTQSRKEKTPHEPIKVK